jgi:hypothetical protein
MNGFQCKIETLRLQSIKQNMLLMPESPILFTNNDIRICKNQNSIKTNSKTSTHDNIHWMNAKNMNLELPRKPRNTTKHRERLLSLQTRPF